MLWASRPWSRVAFLMLFSGTRSRNPFFLLISIADNEKYWSWCFWTLLIHCGLSRTFQEAARCSRVWVPKQRFVCVFSSLPFCVHCGGFVPPCVRGPLLALSPLSFKRAGPWWPLEAGCRSVYPFSGPTSRLGILVAWFPRGGRPECGPVKCNQGLYSVCFRLSQTSWLPHLDLSSQGWYKSLRGQAWVDGFLPVVCWAEKTTFLNSTFLVFLQIKVGFFLQPILMHSQKWFVMSLGCQRLRGADGGRQGLLSICSQKPFRSAARPPTHHCALRPPGHHSKPLLIALIFPLINVFV